MTGGSCGSAAPEGEPRPTLKKQGDATDGGTLTASEGSCGSAAPEGRVPLAAGYEVRVFFFFFFFFLLILLTVTEL